MIVDVADYMTHAMRFTHVTAYLWLVKHAPALWNRIDRFQKRQPQTSPDWYYRRGCVRLFELAKGLRPRALVATEVGCCEIAALLKRDLKLDCPLVAVNVDYDADRSWVQPEIDLYSVTGKRASDELVAHGAPPERVRCWGVPLSAAFGEPRKHEAERLKICEWLSLDASAPLLLIAGGAEGMGEIEAIAARFLNLKDLNLQLIILTGRNTRLKSRCEKLGSDEETKRRVRVLGWTQHIADLMCASDLLVSQLGITFDEALACGLPIVALEPPPGSERVKYRLLEEWKTGRAVRTLGEMAEVVARLLNDRQQLEALREAARARSKINAARLIAGWLLSQEKETCFVETPVGVDADAEVNSLAQVC
jgi:processive 1,2-diacylglycerol beta-glucosyltransferase